MSSGPSTPLSAPTPAIGGLQVTVFVNKSKISDSLGPFLDPKKVSSLPSQFGPGPINRVLRESIQQLVDASIDQKQV
jgi:hypothetical protein